MTRVAQDSKSARSRSSGRGSAYPLSRSPLSGSFFGRQMVQILSLRSGFGHFWSPGRRVSSSPGTCKLWEFGMGVLGTCKRSEPIPGLTAAHGRRASVSEADFGRIEILIDTAGAQCPERRQNAN